MSGAHDLLVEIENRGGDGERDRAYIWALSGAGFVIRSAGVIIYVDSWLVPPDPSRTTHRTYPIPFSPERARRVSAILSTHEHEDHCNVATLIGLHENSRAVLVGPSSVVKKSTRGGFSPSYVREVKAGDIVEDLGEGFKIHVFKANDPYEESAVMYLIETTGGNIFHSGDSAYFGGFKDVGDQLEVDVALLNYGKQIPSPEKPYYMNKEKLSLAARDLHAKVVVPMHWNLWIETREDPGPIENVLRDVSPTSKLTILEGGQKLEIKKRR